LAYSSSEGKAFFKDWLNHVGKALNFQSFLDIGCGAGLYGKIIREVFGPTVRIEAIEIFKEYIDRFNLKEIYNEIAVADIVKVIDLIQRVDLIIAGDVLEHLSKEDAIRVVNGLRSKCRFLWGALPLTIGRPWSVGYQQPASEYEVNPAEKHQHDWTGEEIIKEFKPLFLVPYIMTGSFLVEGDIR